MTQYSFLYLLLILFCFNKQLTTPLQLPVTHWEKFIVIVIPSCNNEQWCKKNLLSALNQNYENYEIIYINDHSHDKTQKIIETLIITHANGHRITLINNKKHCGAMANHYKAVYMSPDDAIIVHLDGDDWLAHNNVLQRINKEYSNPNVWLTYGQFQSYPDNQKGYCRPFPDKIVHNNLFRKYTWVSTHLRTFYAWLFKKIKKDDLLYNNQFVPVACDLAFMFPMLEMARNGHIKCITDILYTYNRATPFNDRKIHLPLVETIEKYIRKKPRYPALD